MFMRKFMMLLGCAAAIFISGCSSDAVSKSVEKNAVLLDVRTPEEFQQKHISGAVNLPLAEIDDRASAVIADKSTPVYVYCRSGRRSKSAMSKLLQQGYGKVTDLGSMENAEKQLSIPR